MTDHPTPPARGLSEDDNPYSVNAYIAKVEAENRALQQAYEQLQKQVDMLGRGITVDRLRAQVTALKAELAGRIEQVTCLEEVGNAVIALAEELIDTLTQ